MSEITNEQMRELMNQRCEREEHDNQVSSLGEIPSSAVIAGAEPAGVVIKDIVVVAVSALNSESVNEVTTSVKDDSNTRTAGGQPSDGPEESGAEKSKNRAEDSISKPVADVPSGSVLTESPKDNEGLQLAIVADSGISVKPGVARVETLKPEYRLPNLTINKTSECKWPIPEGVKFSCNRCDSDNVSVTVSDGNLHFTPLQPGEARVQLPYNDGKLVTFCMTVNPDPWSLWTIKPMGEDDIVFDPSDRRRLETNHKDVIGEYHIGLNVIGASRRGRSHERSGTFRDDDMGVWSDEANGNYVFIVSDGAGSCKYSREGALQSVRFIKDRLEANKDKLEDAWKSADGALKPDCGVGMLLAVLASKAKECLVSLAEKASAEGKDCKAKDFSGTLLMAALKIDPNGGARLVTFSIGDGAIAWRNANNQFELMCRPDSGEFGGGTRFLVTPEVWKTIFFPKKGIPWSWNTFCESRVMCKSFTADEAKGLQVFLMSDGVSDPWFETDAGLEKPEMWHEFATDTLLNSGENKAGLNLAASPEENAEKLWDWLYFKIVGNHDDRTIVMAYKTDSTVKEACNV